MEAIILLGGPGAGKGTLAERVKKNTPYLHVSTGDMLRAAVRTESPLGLEAKACMDEGRLVSDALILQLIKERVEQEATDTRFMFDGFPRTLEQAEGLQDLFDEFGGSVTHILNLVVDTETLIQRLCGRRTCKTCGAIFHVENRPPKEIGICDLCGGELYQRDDDNEETVKNRIEIYKQQTAPLIDFYLKAGVLHNVDVNGSPKQACQIALEALRA